MSLRSVFVCYGVGLLCLLAVAPLITANQVKVGGSMGWTVPTSPNVYNTSRLRFQIGDSLLFVYQQGKDSVLEVSVDDYRDCNTASPFAKFDDGNTVFMFNHSGPYYFISGVKQNCLKNESMVVVVVADRTTTKSASPAPAPSVSSPPALTGEQPSAPPTEVGDNSPPPPPPPPGSRNAAGPLKVVGVLSSIGSLLGLPLLFVF